MLGKLMKYEFKTTARTLLPLYGALIAVSVLMKLLWGVHNSRFFMEDGLMGIMQAVAAIAYGIIIGAVCILTVMLLIQRFYKNLLRDEGYLMHTLPVKPWQNIMAKLIPAVLWSLLSIFMAVLSGMIIGMDAQAWISFFHSFFALMQDFCQEFGAHGVLVALELLLFGVLSLANEILNVYVALAIGHTANSRRIFWSFVAFIGTYVAIVFVELLAMNVWEWAGLAQYFIELFRAHQIFGVHLTMLALCAWTMLVNAVFFFGTNHILKNRLNLE